MERAQYQMTILLLLLLEEKVLSIVSSLNFLLLVSLLFSDILIFSLVLD